MLYLVSGGQNSGKTAMLERLNRSIKGNGVLSKKMYYANQMSGYYLLNVSTGEGCIHILEKTRFFETDNQDDYQENERFCFLNKGYGKGIQWIREGLKAKGPLFIDEIGQLEFVKRKGFYSVLKAAIQTSAERDVYIGVRDENLKYIEAMKEKINFEYKVLKPIHLTAIILASGNSSRFADGNKLMMKLENKTIIEKIIEKVIEVRFFNNIVVIYHDEDIKKVIEKYDSVKALHNENPEKGLSESIKLGVKWAQKDNTDGYMFISADQVGLTTQILRKIADKFFDNSQEIVSPIFIDQCGSPVIFPKKYADELLLLEGDHGGKSLIHEKDYPVVKTYFESKKGLFDIDTVEDYHHYLAEEYRY